MIRITPSISIGEGELEEHFIRASGPGGQNVNKLASAVAVALRRAPFAEPARARARAARAARRPAAHPRGRAGDQRATPSHAGAQPAMTRARVWWS